MCSSIILIPFIIISVFCFNTNTSQSREILTGGQGPEIDGNETKHGNNNEGNEN